MKNATITKVKVMKAYRSRTDISSGMQILFKEDFIMNKAELVAAVADKTNSTKKDAEASINAFLETVEGALKKGDKVQLIGFGTFETTERAARVGQNPQTGEKIDIPASTAPKFKAGKALKDIVNE